MEVGGLRVREPRSMSIGIAASRVGAPSARDGNFLEFNSIPRAECLGLFVASCSVVSFLLVVTSAVLSC